MTFIDTLRYEGGSFVDLSLHLERIRRTALAHGGLLDIGAVETLLLVSRPSGSGLYRVTLYYDKDSPLEVRSVLYERRQINRLYVRELPEAFSYTYKYADRSFFEQAKEGLSEEDEVLFVRSDGSLADTTYTNVLLELPDGILYAPSLPLLRGTQLCRLLEQGRVSEQEGLGLDALRACRRVYLINALLPLEEAITLTPDRIIY